MANIAVGTGTELPAGITLVVVVEQEKVSLQQSWKYSIVLEYIFMQNGRQLLAYKYEAAPVLVTHARALYQPPTLESKSQPRSPTTDSTFSLAFTSVAN